MSKAGRNEARKVAAGFLNGIAVAMLVAGLITPFLSNDLHVWRTVLTVVLAFAAHAAALVLVLKTDQ